MRDRAVPPIGVLVLCALVVIASFLPWGSLQGTPTIQSPFGTMQGPGQVTVSINGWNGTFTPLGMKIPNWVLVVVAMLVAVFAWLRFASMWDVPAINLALAAYGIFHSGVFSIILLLNRSLGIGAIVTLGAFIGIAVLLTKDLVGRKISCAAHLGHIDRRACLPIRE